MYNVYESSIERLNYQLRYGRYIMYYRNDEFDDMINIYDKDSSKVSPEEYLRTVSTLKIINGLDMFDELLNDIKIDIKIEIRNNKIDKLC